ncbi:hypothetical protein Moror_3475 [Moniliophthora roreri MCA 2997]|uniref:Uncharacterized protein n=1 Tax=Moniliophthora roreri (strain MCA 2997) TaxID=1381753 RepID=V2WPM1_MONRO|nr:hypothetical protein Moror_3475 [Moniliophthora roreri MCA 2997]
MLITTCIAISSFIGQGIHATPVNNPEVITFAAPSSTAAATATPSSSITKIDSLQCNITQATIITDLSELGVLLQKVDISNATVAAAVTKTQGSLKTSRDAIMSILSTLIVSEVPPADGRAKTDEGLGIMLEALTGLNL